MSKIKLATGIKTYEIENENGEILGVIKFNPSDVNLYKRVEQFEKDAQEIEAELNECVENDDEDTLKAAMVKADAKFKQSIDDMLGNGTSEIVFGKQNVFNTLDGVTFLERFLIAIIPIIKADIEASSKAKEQKISKYTGIVEALGDK